MQHGRVPIFLLLTFIASANVPEASPNAVSTAIRDALSNSTSAISISILFAQYNSLKSNAVSSNLLSVSSNKLFDVLGRSQSPYDQRNLFIAAPVRSFSNTNALSFVFNSSLSCGNSGSVNSIQIDFGNDYQSVSWGTPINFTFSSKGVKRVKMTRSSGSPLESHFDIQVRQGDVCTSCRYPRTSFDLFQPFYSSANHAAGSTYIKYSHPRSFEKFRNSISVH